MSSLDLMSRVRGAILGGWCGDAAGAVLEFHHGGPITQEMVEHALSMPGGGALKVAPGQITDDSELEICLVNALSTVSIPLADRDVSQYPIDAVAQCYLEWANKTDPFDIGYATRLATAKANTVEQMRTNAERYNKKSQANGALMRCVPIAIWAREMTAEQMKKIVRTDCTLTHPNEICVDAVSVYCVAMAELVKGSECSVAAHALKAHADNATVQKWIQDVDDGVAPGDVTVNTGHIMHAIQLVYKFLTTSPLPTYEEVIKSTLMLGGDTDTNAKIVGAIAGAIYGEEGIPLSMRNKVLSFTCEEVAEGGVGHFRPVTYNTARAFVKLQQLI
ncbi:ADP-ribosylglycohydrolase family protein [archaeon]|nr:MAG: ADP-ribosylglycohydrolase family protein [archaeon]